MAKRIGELLVEHRLLTADQLALALAEQKRSGERLGSVLIRKGYLTVEDFEFLLSRQHSVPAINLLKYNPSPEHLSLVTEKFMKKHFVLPVEMHEKVLTVAMANPHDYKVIDELRFMTGLRVAPVVSSMHGLRAKLRELFPSSQRWEESKDAAPQQDLEIVAAPVAAKEENLEEALRSASDAPVVKMVGSIVLSALAKRASHVHVIPRDDVLDVKLRVNGTLEHLVTPPKALSQNLVNRLKVLAGIDILRRRVPQEGFFRVRSGDQSIDIDVSTFPMKPLEQVVLTFQQQFSKEELRLDNLGMAPEMLERFRATLQARRGLILVLGPHDAGKTSTLYATLNALKSPGRAAVTYENPIKNRLGEINQAEPNEKAGISYTDGLKALIKQDLDYLMVSDVSNPGALAAAVEAALGKTLVLARVIFNHTVGVIPRLVEQGISSFSLYSALTAVVGQRLVRRLCPSCLESYDPPGPVKEELCRVTGRDRPNLYRAVGCEKCNLTGYQGRLGVFELLVPDDALRDLIVRGAPQEELELVARSAGWRSLVEDGLNKAVEGMTTYEEVKGIK